MAAEPMSPESSECRQLLAEEYQEERHHQDQDEGSGQELGDLHLNGGAGGADEAGGRVQEPVGVR